MYDIVFNEHLFCIISRKQAHWYNTSKNIMQEQHSEVLLNSTAKLFNENVHGTKMILDARNFNLNQQDIYVSKDLHIVMH